MVVENIKRKKKLVHQNVVLMRTWIPICACAVRSAGENIKRENSKFAQQYYGDIEKMFMDRYLLCLTICLTQKILESYPTHFPWWATIQGSV